MGGDRGRPTPVRGSERVRDVDRTDRRCRDTVTRCPGLTPGHSGSTPKVALPFAQAYLGRRGHRVTERTTRQALSSIARSSRPYGYLLSLDSPRIGTAITSAHRPGSIGPYCEAAYEDHRSLRTLISFNQGRCPRRNPRWKWRGRRIGSAFA